MKFFNVLVLMFFISSCSEKEADVEHLLEYEKDGLSFSYPANWEVTEDTESDYFRFVFVESPGNAIVKIEVYPVEDSFDLREFVDLDIEALINEIPSMIAVDGSNKVEEINTVINGAGFNGYRFDFNISIVNIDVPHVSEFYAFPSLKKVAYVTNQVAIEDLDKVEGGFKQVLATFKLK